MTTNHRIDHDRQHEPQGLSKMSRQANDWGRIWSCLCVGMVIPLLTACGTGSSPQFGSGEAVNQRIQDVPADDPEFGTPAQRPATLTPAPMADPEGENRLATGDRFVQVQAPLPPRFSPPAAPTPPPPPTESPPPTKETEPVSPPTSIAGAFLLECQSGPEVATITSVAVLCRILKNGVFDPTVGLNPSDWEISSPSNPTVYGAISGITVPNVAKAWSADFALPTGQVAGRRVRVRNTVGGPIPSWLTTTLSSPATPPVSGGLMLADFGGVNEGRGIHLGDNNNASYLAGGGISANCPASITTAPLSGLGVQSKFKASGASTTISVTLRGLCGITTILGPTPFQLAVRAVASNTIVHSQRLGGGDFVIGPISLGPGDYQVTLETVYDANNLRRYNDAYDDVGFTAMLIVPLTGSISTTTTSFF